MKKVLYFAGLMVPVFLSLIISCNMPSDPFKKPSNSKVKLFLGENEHTIDFGSEVKIGVSIFLAEHIEALHINTRNNGLDTVHPYSSNAVDDTLYFYHKFNVEGKDTIFVTGMLKDKKYINKTDTLPVFILPAPDSIRFDSVPEPYFTVAGKVDTLVFIASARSEKPLSFSVKSNPGLDSKEISVKKIEDTAKVIISTDNSGEYTVTLYAQRDTLTDSASVKVTIYEPLEFQNVTLSDTVTFGKSDTLVFVLPSQRKDTLSFELLNRKDFKENELFNIVENKDSLVIVFTPYRGGVREFLLLLDNGKIADTLKYTITVDDDSSVELFIESFKDSVPLETPVNIGITVFIPELFEELHINTSDKSLDTVLESPLIDDTVYLTHSFLNEGKIVIYVTGKPVNSDKKQQTDSLTLFVQPEPQKIPVWNIQQKTVSAIEGQKISVDLRPFINESFSGGFSLDSDFGEVKDTVWKWTPPWGSDTTKTAVISAACDSDEYELKLNVSVAEGDTTGPTITLLHSSMNDTLIGSSQIYVEAVVKDSRAGVSSVQISYGSNSANMALTEDSIYIGLVRDLKIGEKTKIKIVAKDGSMRKNLTEHVFYVTYDSIIGDNVAPVISQESGPENGSRITDGQVQLSFSVTDDSDIDSVYWTFRDELQGFLEHEDSVYSLSGTLDKPGSYEIDIVAVDKSVNKNRNVLKMSFDYNTEITDIEIVSPSDSASGIDTNVTLKWNGGQDKDKDTVFFKIYYGTSESNLNNKITGKNCNSLVITQTLESYTDYYWQIIAYSKVYPDTVKSDIYSFKTTSVPPEIISQPEGNIDIDIGEKVVLRVKATGKPDPSYRWVKNGTVITGKTNDSLVIIDASVTDSGEYLVEVYNGGGTVNSDKVDLKVIYPVKIAAAMNHSLILKSNGILLACGYNCYGQLGDGTTEDKITPVQIMKDVHSIATSNDHSLILKNNGILLACGYNCYGQLGDGTTEDKATPVQIMEDVHSIAAGNGYSLILKSNGNLWACGYNSYGQLGDGTTEDKATPIQIMEDVHSIAAGNGHSLILKSNGNLWACGYNSYGQLGDGTIDKRITPVKIMESVLTIAAGYNHSLILKTDKTLWACGYNSYGQLGDGSKDNRTTPVKIMESVQAIAAGYYHSLILKSDGTLFACGANNYGQFGDGTTDSRITPVKSMEGVQAVAVGSYHSFILKTDGTLFACGNNTFGQLGDGTSDNKNKPVRVLLK